MKKYLHLFSALLLLLFLSNSLTAQFASIEKLVIIPSNPGANDSLSVIGFTMFTSGGCKLKNYSFSGNGDTISILADHTVGILTVICYSADTIPIGKLNAGTYEIIYSLAANSVIRDTDTIDFAVRQFVGAEYAVASEKKMEIYPNPATNTITISSLGSLTGETTVSVFNMGSQLLLYSGFRDREQIVMDVSSLPEGIYSIKIRTKTGTLSRKLVIL